MVTSANSSGSTGMPSFSFSATELVDMEEEEKYDFYWLNVNNGLSLNRVK